MRLLETACRSPSGGCRGPPTARRKAAHICRTGGNILGPAMPQLCFGPCVKRRHRRRHANALRPRPDATQVLHAAWRLAGQAATTAPAPFFLNAAFAARPPAAAPTPSQAALSNEGSGSVSSEASRTRMLGSAQLNRTGVVRKMPGCVFFSVLKLLLLPSDTGGSADATTVWPYGVPRDQTTALLENRRRPIEK